MGLGFNAWIERAIHLVQLPWGVCGMGWFIWNGEIVGAATEGMAVHGLRDMFVGFMNYVYLGSLGHALR